MWIRKFLRRISSTALFVIGACTLAGMLQAAPVLFCKDGQGIDLATTGCISGESRWYPGGGDSIYDNAGGGDSESAVETAIVGATGIFVDITLYGKSDENSGLFLFGPTDPTTSQSGTFTVLDGTPIRYITVKAANSFALYDIGGVSAGSYTTDGILDNGGQQPNVSHISFFTVRTNPIPEPSSFALIGLGVGAFAFARRRCAKT